MADTLSSSLTPRNAYYATKAQAPSIDLLEKVSECLAELNCLKGQISELSTEVTSMNKKVAELHTCINLIDVLINIHEQEISEWQLLRQESKSVDGESEGINDQNSEC